MGVGTALEARGAKMSWKHSLAAVLSVLALSAAGMASLAQPAGSTSEIRFRPGSDRTVVNGRVRGVETRRYTFRARAGQTLRVILRRANRFLYFNVVRPGGAVLVNGATMPNAFTSTRLPAAGVYRIDVYLNRIEARRGPVAPFRMTVSVSD
jgi:hypothetical protein